MNENYEQKPFENGKEGGLWVPKEERGHIRSAEEVEKAKKLIPEDKRIESEEEKAKKRAEWQETFYKMGGTRGKERIKLAEEELARERETKKILEEISKESEKSVSKEKPKEDSFGEAQKRLEEKLKRERKPGGGELSENDKYEITRNFYLGELGYSVKYKGIFRGKAELLNEKGKVIADRKGKHFEFKTHFNPGEREEKPLLDFLKKELRKKLEGKAEKKQPEKERTAKKERKPKEKSEEKKEQDKSEKAEKTEQGKIDWLEAAIEKIKKGNIVAFTPRRLEQYLIKNGIPESKIRKMKPEEALQEAVKIYTKRTS